MQNILIWVLILYPPNGGLFTYFDAGLESVVGWVRVGVEPHVQRRVWCLQGMRRVTAHFTYRKGVSHENVDLRFCGPISPFLSWRPWWLMTRKHFNFFVNLQKYFWKDVYFALWNMSFWTFSVLSETKLNILLWWGINSTIISTPR